MPPVVFSDVGVVLANGVMWGCAHALSGYRVYRLAVSDLQHDGPLLRLRPCETGGRVYERRVRIRSWKDRLPEAGDLFAGGYDKKQTPRRTTAGLERYAAETRRAERGHWLCLSVLPIFALWNSPVGMVLMAVYGVAANAPFIAIQRYNRARVLRILERRSARRPGRVNGDRAVARG